MKPARLPVMAVIAAVTCGLGWLALAAWAGAGGDPLPVPWTAVAGLAALAMVVVAAGLPVRRWQHGRRDRRLDPLTAARTAVLGKAAAYAGALLCGWYAAQALTVLPDVVGARRTRLVMALAAAACAAAVAAAGLVVQRWCRVPPGDDLDAGDGAEGQDTGA